jgi:hypothetical protein
MADVVFSLWNARRNSTKISITLAILGKFDYKNRFFIGHRKDRHFAKTALRKQSPKAQNHHGDIEFTEF